MITHKTLLNDYKALKILIDNALRNDEVLKKGAQEALNRLYESALKREEVQRWK